MGMKRETWQHGGRNWEVCRRLQDLNDLSWGLPFSSTNRLDERLDLFCSRSRDFISVDAPGDSYPAPQKSLTVPIEALRPGWPHAEMTLQLERSPSRRDLSRRCRWQGGQQCFLLQPGEDPVQTRLGHCQQSVVLHPVWGYILLTF